jgi:hypothetical protein
MDNATGTEVKDLASMANQLKMKNQPKNIEDYLTQAADVLEGAGKEMEKDENRSIDNASAKVTEKSETEKNQDKR